MPTLEEILNASRVIKLTPDQKKVLWAIDYYSRNKELENLTDVFQNLKDNPDVDISFLKMIITQISEGYISKDDNFGKYLQNSMDIIQVASGKNINASEIKYWRFYKERKESENEEDRSLFALRAYKLGKEYYRDIDEISRDDKLKKIQENGPIIENGNSKNDPNKMYIPIYVKIKEINKFLGVIETNNNKQFSERDLILTDYFCSEHFSEQLSRYFTERRDTLTNSYTRKAMSDLILSEAKRTVTSGEDLSVIVTDIDDFKKVNDTRGHDAGDKVLTEFSRLLYENTRPTDRIIRYGGEEFLIILPSTSINKAYNIAERIRTEVENFRITINNKPLWRITASFGVNYLDNETLTEYIKDPSAIEVISEDLIKPADRQLYNAKYSGKNKVCGYELKIKK